MLNDVLLFCWLLTKFTTKKSQSSRERKTLLSLHVNDYRALHALIYKYISLINSLQLHSKADIFCEVYVSSLGLTRIVQIRLYFSESGLI